MCQHLLDSPVVLVASPLLASLAHPVVSSLLASLVLRVASLLPDSTLPHDDRYDNTWNTTAFMRFTSLGLRWDISGVRRRNKTHDQGVGRDLYRYHSIDGHEMHCWMK